MKYCTSLAAALIVTASLSTAYGQATLYWDIDGANPGAGGTAPSGGWDIATTANWSLDPAGASATQTFANGDHVIFSAGTEGVDDPTGAYGITVTGVAPVTPFTDPGIVAPGSLTIDDGRVILSGTAIYLGANPSRVNQGATLQIPSLSQVVLASGQVMTLDGGTIRNLTVGLGSGMWSGLGKISLTSNGGSFDVPTGSGAYSIMGYFGTTIDMTPGTTSATLTKKGDHELRLRPASSFTTLDNQGGLVRVDGTGGSDLSLGDANGTVITHGGAVANTTAGTALGTSITITSPATRSFVLNDDQGPDTMIVTNALWTINGNISGPGGIMLNGWTREDTNAIIGNNQTVTLGGNNTFGGDVTINFGTIQVTGGNAIPDTSDVIISTNTTWGVTTTLNNATLQVSASETIGTITGGTHTANGDAANRGNMALNGAGVVLTLGTANDFTYTGGASGTGGFTKVGAGTMTIRHYDYTNSGPTTISQGKIVLGTSSAGLGLSSTVTINTGAEWDMATFNDTIGNLAGTGLISNGNNLSLNNTANATFSGTMALTGFFRKNAAAGAGTTTVTSNISAAEIRAEGGTFEFTGSNTISTSVTVAGGRLLANNAAGSATGAAPIAVTSGTLGGTGTVAGAVTVSGTGHIAPGPATGIESLAIGGGLTLNAGSILDFDLGAPGVSDLINVTLLDGLNIAGSTTVNYTDAGGLAAGTYTLIDYAGTLGGSFGNLTLETDVDPIFDYALVNTGSTIDLTVSAAAPGDDADFNDDGTVDAADYAIWRKVAAPGPGVGDQQTGDADGDGIVDGTDNGIWEEQFNDASPGSGGGGAVPEPTTFAMVLIGLASLAAGRRGR